MPPSRQRVSERGNVFVIILVGVALFAALAFTISRSMRSTTTTQMTERELLLAASEIIEYAQKIGRAVDRVRRKGCSETQISFENDIAGGYTPGAAPPPKCEVFSNAGGGISWQSPAQGVNNGSEWVITGGNRIKNIGDDAIRDLIIVLPYVDKDLCDTINERLGVSLSTMPPVDTVNSDITTQFTGTFGSGSPVIGGTGGAGTPNFENISTVCYEGDNTPASGTYHFYHVLLAR